MIQEAIDEALRRTRPHTSARMQALAQVRWVLATADGCFVRIDDRGNADLVPELARATVYDGRDNEQTRAAFMRALFGCEVRAVLLPTEH